MKSEFNRFDYFIIFLIASLAFGAIGGSLQVVRLLTIIFFPTFFRRFVFHSAFYGSYVNCVIVFLLYASISLFWTPDRGEGLKELFYFFVHFLAFFEILVFSKYARKPLESIPIGWLVSVSMTLVVAMWEITTDQHLQWSRMDSDTKLNIGSEIILRRFAAVTFYNYNGYVTFLCFALPFVLFFLLKPGRTYKNSFIPIIAVLLSAVCILINASRGGLLTLILMSIFLFRHYGVKRLISRSSIMLIGLSAYVAYRFGNIISLVIGVRAEHGIVNPEEGRLVIWQNVLRAFSQTYGLGTGIGGIAKEMSNVTMGILVPHNIFLEILLEFGVLFFIVFVLFYVQTLKKILFNPNSIYKSMLLMALIPFPIYTIINSRYLLSPYVFIAFASLIVFINHERFRPIC